MDRYHLVSNWTCDQEYLIQKHIFQKYFILKFGQVSSCLGLEQWNLRVETFLHNFLPEVSFSQMQYPLTSIFLSFNFFCKRTHLSKPLSLPHQPHVLTTPAIFQIQSSQHIFSFPTSHMLAMSNVTCNPFVYFWLNKVRNLLWWGLKC